MRGVIRPSLVGLPLVSVWCYAAPQTGLCSHRKSWGMLVGWRNQNGLTRIRNQVLLFILMLSQIQLRIRTLLCWSKIVAHQFFFFFTFFKFKFLKKRWKNKSYKCYRSINCFNKFSKIIYIFFIELAFRSRSEFVEQILHPDQAKLCQSFGSRSRYATLVAKGSYIHYTVLYMCRRQR